MNEAAYSVRNPSHGIKIFDDNGRSLPKLAPGTLIFGAARSKSIKPYAADYELGVVIGNVPEDPTWLSILWGCFEADDDGSPAGSFSPDAKPIPSSWNNQDVAFWRRLAIVGHVAIEAEAAANGVEWNDSLSSPPCFYTMIEATALARAAVTFRARLMDCGRGAKRRIQPNSLADSPATLQPCSAQPQPLRRAASAQGSSDVRAAIASPSSAGKARSMSHGPARAGGAAAGGGAGTGAGKGVAAGAEDLPTTAAGLVKLANRTPLLRQKITGGPITSKMTSRRGMHDPSDICLTADLAGLIAGGAKHMYDHLLGTLRSGRLPQERGGGRPGAGGPQSTLPYSLCARRLHELCRLVLRQRVTDYAALLRALDTAFPLAAPHEAGGSHNQSGGDGGDGGGDNDVDVSGSAAGCSEAATRRANKRAKTAETASSTPVRASSTTPRADPIAVAVAGCSKCRFRGCGVCRNYSSSTPAALLAVPAEDASMRRERAVARAAVARAEGSEPSGSEAGSAMMAGDAGRELRRVRKAPERLEATADPRPRPLWMRHSQEAALMEALKASAAEVDAAAEAEAEEARRSKRSRKEPERLAPTEDPRFKPLWYRKKLHGGDDGEGGGEESGGEEDGGDEDGGDEKGGDEAEAMGDGIDDVLESALPEVEDFLAGAGLSEGVDGESEDGESEDGDGEDGHEREGGGDDDKGVVSGEGDMEFDGESERRAGGKRRVLHEPASISSLVGPSAIFVGMRCQAKYRASASRAKHKWYPGKVIAVDTAAGTCTVHYDDGETEHGMLPKYIRALQEPPAEQVAGAPQPQAVEAPEPQAVHKRQKLAPAPSEEGAEQQATPVATGAKRSDAAVARPRLQPFRKDCATPGCNLPEYHLDRCIPERVGVRRAASAARPQAVKECATPGCTLPEYHEGLCMPERVIVRKRTRGE